MQQTTVYCDVVTTEMRTGPDVKEITRELAEVVKKSAVQEGSMHATVMGSTGSITAIEYEPGVVQDLKRAVNRLAPPELDYEHEKGLARRQWA